MKLLIVGVLTFGTVQTIHSVVRPDVSPEGRRAQAAQQYSDWQELSEKERRRLLRRGIDADNLRRLRGTSQPVPPPRADGYGRFLNKLPKPRIPLRVR